MGQRLVITVIQNEEDIAKIYYHWSAYSLSALQETREVLDCLLNNDNPIKDLRLRLIRFVESRGGCIDGGSESEEFKAIQEMYPNEKFKSDGSRNEGLIALTEDGMNSIQSWSEGDVDINLDYGMIYNSVYWSDDFDYYKEQWEEERKNLKLEDIPEYNINISEISFNELDNIISFLNKYHGYEYRIGNMVYSLIA